jgi:hypothetical protein
MTSLHVRIASFLAALAVGAIASPASAGAQAYPASQRAGVSQMVALTNITVEYGRPTARGRVLFGDTGVVKWNRVWHPGADSATRIAFDHDVVFEGKPLRAGSYTLWLIPKQREPWVVIVSRAAHVFHIPYPGESQDVMRVNIAAERGEHMETLAIYFPVVVRDEAVMRIHWGETVLPIHIKAPYRP